MQGIDLKENEDGTYSMQSSDHRLNVATGEEADQEWPDEQASEEVMPLLNLPEAWQSVILEEPLPSNDTEFKNLTDQNADVLTKELSYHLLVTRKNHVKPLKVPNHDDLVSQADEDLPKPTSGTEDSEAGDSKVTPPGPESDIKADGKSEKSEPLKSVYGAGILLQLQWKETETQKKVPYKNYVELGHFIGDIVDNLNKALSENEKAGKAVADAFALDLTPLILARYLDGLETCTEVLERNAFKILSLCAVKGSTKEMHLGMVQFMRRIEIVYLEATSYLVLKPLMSLWTKLILRMQRMRHKFLKELLKEFDHLLSYAQSYEASFVPDSGGRGVE